MIVTVTSHKGGVGKSTTAIHIASFLQTKAPTLLVDDDQNGSVLAWSTRGPEPLFKVISGRLLAKYAGKYQNIVIDTPARPSQADLKGLVENCDLLVIPSTPDAFALHALMQTVADLKKLDAEAFKVLLTICPPWPSKDPDEAREMLKNEKVPVFAAQIKRLSAFSKSALRGITVDKVSDPRAPAAWSDYEAIGKEILKG